jgi:hypothetical protein
VNRCNKRSSFVEGLRAEGEIGSGKVTKKAMKRREEDDGKIKQDSSLPGRSP